MPEVDSISEDDFGSVIEQVQEAIGESGRPNIEVADKTIIAGEIGFDILSYFAFTSAIIEQRSAYLLRESLIAEELRQKEEIFEFIDETLSQHQREELLYNCRMIDGDLKNDLTKIRRFRNRLVHDPRERQIVDSTDIEEIVSLALSSAKQLDQNLHNLLQERYA